MSKLGVDSTNFSTSTMILNFVNLYFYVRPSKVKGKRGNLYVRTVINGKQIVASVKSIQLFPSDFNVKTQNVKPKCELYLEATSFMLAMRQRIAALQNKYEQKRMPFSKEILEREIKEAFNALKDNQTEVLTFDYFFGTFLNEEERGIGVLISKGTHLVRRRYRGVLSIAFKETGIFETPIGNIELEHLESIKLHLCKKYAVSSASKIWHMISMIFEFAKKKKEIPSNPCKEMSTISLATKGRPVWNEQHELVKLMQLELTSEQEAIRDAYIFCCYTGLSQGDYKLLNRKTSKDVLARASTPVNVMPGELIDTVSGKFLVGTRRKTGTMFRIPILPQVQLLIDKYGGIEKLPFFLVRSTEILNRLMKMIGCEKEIRFHTARKSMANYLINVVMMNPFYVVNVMGWVKIEEAAPYTIVTDETLAKQMFA